VCCNVTKAETTTNYGLEGRKKNLEEFELHLPAQASNTTHLLMDEEATF
jgi:hypothetical protein